LSGFLLDLRQSLAHQGLAKILDISTGMSAFFANPYASRSQHISSQKIAQLRFKQDKDFKLALQHFINFPVYPLNGIDSYIKAAQLHRKCRKRGITIRKTADCIIAQTAIENQLLLLHNDVDFDRIASCCPLRIYKK